MKTAPRHVLSLTAIVFALVLLGRGGVASACSCKDLSVSEAFAQAETVFVGAVSDLGLDYSKHERVTGFNVQRVLKGAVSKRVRVVSALYESACGYPFARDTVYLVFTRTISGRVFTSFCAGNRALAAGAQPPPELGAGSAPAKPAQQPRSTGV
jgi:hypothetical protein